MTGIPDVLAEVAAVGWGSVAVALILTVAVLRAVWIERRPDAPPPRAAS